MTDIDWADLRVGDPDPTPDEPPWCGRFLHPDQAESPVCTRRPDHDGPHVAGDGLMPTPGCDFGRSVVAIWTDDVAFHQTPGPAVTSPYAGPGPRVPVPARGAAAGTGDPANIDRLRRDAARRITAVRELFGDDFVSNDDRVFVAVIDELTAARRERDEARASLATALGALARIQKLHRSAHGRFIGEQVCADCGDAVPCRTVRALEPPGCVT